MSRRSNPAYPLLGTRRELKWTKLIIKIGTVKTLQVHWLARTGLVARSARFILVGAVEKERFLSAVWAKGWAAAEQVLRLHRLWRVHLRMTRRALRERPAKSDLFYPNSQAIQCREVRLNCQVQPLAASPCENHLVMSKMNMRPKRSQLRIHAEADQESRLRPDCGKASG